MHTILPTTTTPTAPVLHCTCPWTPKPDCPAHGIHDNPRRGAHDSRPRNNDIAFCSEPLCRGSYINDDHPHGLCPGCRD